jgi:translation initiation factor IF-1
MIEARGEVTQCAGGGFYRVKVGDSTLLGTLGGKMRQNHIRVLPGDEVDVLISPYDLSRCILVYRFK